MNTRSQRTKIVLMALGLSLLISEFALASESWSAYWHNKKALKAIENNDFPNAVSEIQKGLSANGLEAVLHYNLGSILEANKDFETAAKQYSMAARLSAVNDLKFESLFNAGHAYGEAKKIPEALAKYQKALELRPDSVEVKTNIELLLSQNQGGGGGGGSEQQDQNQNSQQNQQQAPQQQKPKEQKRKFESRELSEQEVRRILDELKRQEEKIREKELNKKQQKETPGGKDW